MSLNYLHHHQAALAEYVEYEGRCLSMLADRLVAGRTELVKLQAEHDAYQGLHMKVACHFGSITLSAFCND